MNYGKAHQIALCGVLGALMIVVMLLGSIIPLTTYFAPLIAALLLIPALREYGAGAGGTLLLAIGILGLLLVPDKELALLFLLLFGPYTLLQPRLSRIPFRVLRYGAKFLLCNLLLALVYALLLLVISPAALVAEFSSYSTALLVLLLVMANVLLFAYDRILERFVGFYNTRLRPRIFHPKRNKQ